MKFLIYGGDENQTFNDNNYEYDEIALPFLRNLGEAIYEIELNRQRKNEPDLSRFRFPERDTELQTLIRSQQENRS